VYIRLFIHKDLLRVFIEIFFMIEFSKIHKLLDRDKIDQLKRIIKSLDIPDMAVLIDQLVDRDKIRFYLLLPTAISSDVLLEVSQHSRKFILKSLKDKYIISLVERSESDDSADILSEVPQHKIKNIFARLTKKKISMSNNSSSSHLMNNPKFGFNPKRPQRSNHNEFETCRKWNQFK